MQRAHKAAALGRILDIEAPTAALVFCRTRTEVDMLTETMNGRGYRAEALHGGMDQAQRDRVMGRLRDGTAELLIATDVAARGLDVDTLTHVVNYDVPSAPDSYVHRIGRVGRAGREGVAITLAEPRERRQLANIETATEATHRHRAGAERRRPAGPAGRADRRARCARRWRPTISTTTASCSSSLADDGDLRSIALAAHQAGPRGQRGDGRRAGDPDHRRSPSQAARRPARARLATGATARWATPAGSEATAFVQISLGRNAGVRPADLVGAIANEAGLTGADIGPIRITEHSSVVGVPVSSVERWWRRCPTPSCAARRVGARPLRRAAPTGDRSIRSPTAPGRCQVAQ